VAANENPRLKGGADVDFGFLCFCLLKLCGSSRYIILCVALPRPQQTLALHSIKP
jgi:hypothetical protein